jgi:chromosomal replication initiation ATPase DnaA
MLRDDGGAPGGASIDWSRIKTRKPENVARRDRLADLVSQFFDVTLLEMQSPRRCNHICHARFVLCYLLREDVKLSWGAIGRYLKKDHSTIIYNHRKARDFHGAVIETIRGKNLTEEGK